MRPMIDPARHRRGGAARGAMAAAALVAACSVGPSRRDLESPIPERRAAAVASLAASRDEGDLAALLVAARDPSPLVRKASAGAFTALGGPRAVDALGGLLRDPDPEVAVGAARGLGAMPHASAPTDARQADALQKRARQHLTEAYGQAGPQGRAEIAASLHAIGTSLREAVETEARQLWDRNLRALAAGTLAERCGAAEELGRSGRAEAVRRLAPLATPGGSEPALLAAAAARGLGGTGDRSARETLEDLLEGPVGLAEAAAEALGTLGDAGAAEALAKAGATGAPRLSAAVVEALALLPPASEVGVALCEIAVRSLDPAVASRAARQARLREADCPERPLTARIARRGPDAIAAMAALSHLGLGGARLAQPADRTLALFGGAAESSLRAAAARTLGEIGWTAAGPALLKRGQLLQQRLADARQKWVLGPLPGAFAPGFEKGRPTLEAVLSREGHGAGPPAADGLPPEWIEDVDPGDVQELAAIAVALARLRTEGGAPLLASLLSDPDDQVRSAAVEAVGLIGGEGAPESVARALRDPSPAVRLAAAAVIPRFGAAAVPPLAGALQAAEAADGPWRSTVARALGETGSAEAVAPLAALLAGPQAPPAAAALGHLASRDGARPLVEFLERPGALGRVEAIEALGQIGAVDGGAVLVGDLTSDRPEVRAAAARALGRLRYEASSGRLEALRGDYFREVRRASIEALARLPVRAPGRR
jgi:HEAT repeat protein